MICRDVQEHDLVDRYVAGTLSEDERSEFEIHYLGCERCAEDVELAMAIRDALQGSAVKRRFDPSWAAAAAALLVVGLGAWWTLRDASAPPPPMAQAPTPPPGPSVVPSPGLDAKILELAQISPPDYEESQLRGTGGATFRGAMREYLKGRYPEAIRGLEKAASEDPTADHVRFFLGASYLLDGRTEPAIEALRIVARDRESAFAEEGRFYLAKALLRAGRPDDARAELRALASGGGAWAADARELLTQLN